MDAASRRRPLGRWQTPLVNVGIDEAKEFNLLVRFTQPTGKLVRDEAAE